MDDQNQVPITSGGPDPSWAWAQNMGGMGAPMMGNPQGGMDQLGNPDPLASPPNQPSIPITGAGYYPGYIAGIPFPTWNVTPGNRVYDAPSNIPYSMIPYPAEQGVIHQTGMQTPLQQQQGTVGGPFMGAGMMPGMMGQGMMPQGMMPGMMGQGMMPQGMMGQGMMPQGMMGNSQFTGAGANIPPVGAYHSGLPPMQLPPAVPASQSWKSKGDPYSLFNEGAVGGHPGSEESIQLQNLWDYGLPRDPRGSQVPWWAIPRQQQQQRRGGPVFFRGGSVRPFRYWKRSR